ncbi:hypothetical protein Tco_0326755 [Tanacetum coccineum]
MPWSEHPPSLDYVLGPEHPPSPDYVPGPEYSEYLVPFDDEVPIEDQPLHADGSPTTLSPGYVVDSDPSEEDPNEDPEEDPTDYPTDRGYDDDEEKEEESSEADDVDEEDEASKEEDDEDEEHLAPIRIRRARKTVGPQPRMTTFSEALIAEYASAPTPPSPPPSLLSPLSSPLPRIPSPPTHTSPTYAEAPLGYRAAMIRSRVDKDDIPEVDMSLQKRARFSAPASRFKVGESSAAAAARKAEHADNAQIIHVFYGVICSLKDIPSIKEVKIKYLYTLGSMKQEKLKSQAGNCQCAPHLPALESRYFHEGRTIDPSFYRDLSDDSVAKFANIEFNMSRTISQAEIVSEEQLVPRANRLVIKKNNQRVTSDSHITDTMLRFVIEILRHHKLYKPVSLTATILIIYLHQLWITINHNKNNHTFTFELDTHTFTLTPELLRIVLQMPPPDPNHTYTKPPSKNQILEFIKTLGYDEDHETKMIAV